MLRLFKVRLESTHRYFFAKKSVGPSSVPPHLRPCKLPLAVLTLDDEAVWQTVNEECI